MSLEIVSPSTRGHFNDAARLHAQGITEGFLSTLGEPFLATLYKAINQADHSGVLVAVAEGETLGFISWTRDVKSCYKQVLKSQWPGLVWTMLPNAIKPSLYRKVFETLRYPASHDQTRPAGSPLADGLRPELLSMAVADEARGKGVGKMLVAAVDAEMIRLKLPGYFVVTHAVDERSNSFYQGCGFLPTDTYQSHGKPMKEYFKDLA